MDNIFICVVIDGRQHEFKINTFHYHGLRKGAKAPDKMKFYAGIRVNNKQDERRAIKRLEGWDIELIFHKLPRGGGHNFLFNKLDRKKGKNLIVLVDNDQIKGFMVNIDSRYIGSQQTRQWLDKNDIPYRRLQQTKSIAKIHQVLAMYQYLRRIAIINGIGLFSLSKNTMLKSFQSNSNYINRFTIRGHLGQILCFMPGVKSKFNAYGDDMQFAIDSTNQAELRKDHVLCSVINDFIFIAPATDDHIMHCPENEFEERFENYTRYQKNNPGQLPPLKSLRDSFKEMKKYKR